MFRRFFLLFVALCPVLAAQAGVNEFPDGTTWVIQIDGAQGDDFCTIHLTDDDSNNLPSEAEIEITLNGQEYTRYVDFFQYDTVYVMFRGWNGNDDCIVSSSALDFPESFFIYFDGDNGDDTFFSNEDVPCWVLGKDGNDVLTTGGGDDEIYGGDGFDVIDAGPGNDVLQGGTDGVADDLIGGAGADEMGKTVYKPMLNAAGWYQYITEEEENYLDFNAAEGDEITTYYRPMPQPRRRTSRTRR